MKSNVLAQRGWCSHCGGASHGVMMHVAKMKPSRWWGCRDCGSPLKTLAEMSPEEKAIVEMQDWFANVCRSGLNGPSPQDAARELGCHRSMIDRLIGLGVLEKSEFAFKGQKLIIISQRSLTKAEENRKRTGNWTGFPVRRGK